MRWKHFWYILAAGVVFRIIFVLLFSDLKNDYYWEYGATAKNIVNGRGYSLYYFQDDLLRHKYQEDKTPFPSAYMPPGYVFFLTPFMLLKSLIFRNLLILLIQTFISAAAACQLFNFTQKKISEEGAFGAATIYLLTPEFIYASATFTPTVLFHFLIFFILNRLDQDENTKQTIFTSILITIAIFIRTEIALFVSMVIAWGIYSRQLKKSAILTAVVLCLLLPWSIRNYIVFDEIVPLTTNAGYNLYRGTHLLIGQNTSYEGVDSVHYGVPRDNNYEIHCNEKFLEATVKTYQTEQIMVLTNYVKKIFNYWLFNPDDPRSYNVLYLFPWVLILLFSVAGLIKFYSEDKFRNIYFLLFVLTLSATIVFSLPRHQTMMKILLLPFAGGIAAPFITRYLINPVIRKRNN